MKKYAVLYDHRYGSYHVVFQYEDSDSMWYFFQGDITDGEKATTIVDALNLAERNRED